ncbi:unnamed protein product [Blepharisma stoltei]|uniref:PNPLA domain-containing protein n=1 Tax=Blepharisma stoltei TaxID=1481888 RepID=A0AAU9IJV3_9CILI|nr:unnamed protein product [Blepharisma stoltei]
MVEQIKSLVIKCESIRNISISEDAVNEIKEIYSVSKEISNKLYKKLISLIWDVGDIIIYQQQLKKSRDWKSWYAAAEQIDKIEGKEEWKKREQSPLYDYRLLRRRLKLIRSLRQQDDIPALVHHLRSGLLRGLGGSLNSTLYTKTLVDTKYLIMEYQDEVSNALRHVLHSQKYPLLDKVKFFSASRYAFGKTALLMSGGGGLGIYHLGVVKALYDQGLMPRILCGTSAGSMVASFIGTTKWEEIPKWFEKGALKYGPFEGLAKGSVQRKIKRLFKQGHLMDSKTLEVFLRANLGEVTFEEAYEATGIILNITVSESGSFDDFRLLNYLTAPHVLVWSAALASCAIPFVFQSVELKCKDHNGQTVPFHPSGLKFIDGTIKADLPTQKLAEMFNVNAFIVSQTNPWVLPFLTPEDGGGTWGDSFKFKLFKAVKRLIMMEFRHRVQQLNLLDLSSTLTWFLSIFTQEYRGHVTIWPIPSLKDYVNILSNPTDEDIQRCIRKGQLRTFPKINMLKSIMAIEKTFESCYHELRDRVHSQEKRKFSMDGQPDEIILKESLYQTELDIIPDIKNKFENQEVIVDAL